LVTLPNDFLPAPPPPPPPPKLALRPPPPLSTRAAGFRVSGVSSAAVRPLTRRSPSERPRQPGSRKSGLVPKRTGRASHLASRSSKSPKKSSSSNGKDCVMALTAPPKPPADRGLNHLGMEGLPPRFIAADVLFSTVKIPLASPLRHRPHVTACMRHGLRRKQPTVATNPLTNRPPAASV
jgi:hypothetical protein